MPRQTVQEYLGVPAEWPVREKIRHEILLMPDNVDIKTAKKKDPQACALHNCACRIFSIPNCAIGGRWAYIPQRDSKGKYYIARMQAPIDTQKAIKHFDKTGEMPRFGFRFVPIAPSHTYKRKNTYNKGWSAAVHVAAMMTPTNGKRAKAIDPTKKRKITKRMRKPEDQPR